MPRACAGSHQGVPQLAGQVVGDDQLVATLTGVARAAHHHARGVAGGAGQGSLDEGHVVVSHRQPDRGEHLVGPGALDGEHGVVAMVVAHGDALGRLGLETPDDLGGVGRVGHQENVLVVLVIGDEVVDDATRRGVAAEGVLRLPRGDPAEVVGERGVHVRRRSRAGDHGLAEVRDVEDADALAHGRVLLDHTRGVLQRHRPPTELRELRTQCDVPVVQRGLQQGAPGRGLVRQLVRHGGEGTPHRCDYPARVTTYTLRGASPAKTRADAVVVGLVQARNTVEVAAGGEDVAAAYGRKLRPLLAGLGAKGKVGEVTKVPTNGTISSPLVVFVGMGRKADVDHTAVRRAAGVAARSVANAASVALALPGDSAELVGADGRGLPAGRLHLHDVQEEGRRRRGHPELGRRAQRGGSQAGGVSGLRPGPGRRRRGRRDARLGQPAARRPATAGLRRRGARGRQGRQQDQGGRQGHREGL